MRNWLLNMCGALLAFAMVLAACPTEVGDTPPSGYIGEKTLALKGKVYTSVNGDFTAADTSYKKDIDGIPGGTGKIAKGELSFSAAPPGGLLDDTLDAEAVSVLTGGSLYDAITVTPAGTRYAFLSLRTEEGIPLESYNVTLGKTSVKSEYVKYIYVSNDADISGIKSKSLDMWQSDKLVLSLGKGWNIVYRRQEVKSSGASFSLKVEKHNLKWVITQ